MHFVINTPVPGKLKIIDRHFIAFSASLSWANISESFHETDPICKLVFNWRVKLALNRNEAFVVAKLFVANVTNVSEGDVIAC